MILDVKRALALESSPAVSLGLDDALMLLANSRRRETIRYVVANDGDHGVPLDDLARAIAAIEHETKSDPAAISSRERKAVYVGLYQEHLPRLDDAGVVEFTRDNTVLPTAAAVALDGLLDDIEATVGGASA